MGKTAVLTTRHFPWLCGGALVGAAFFPYPAGDYALVGLMLFLPLLDHSWRIPPLPRGRWHYLAWAVLPLIGAVLLVWHPAHTSFIFSTLMMAALPEEWFFRAYFMSRVGNGLRANMIASMLFSGLHGLTRGWGAALLVFMPSLFYGWLYQRTRDLPLLVLVHALSNLVYTLFLARIVATWLPNMS